MKKQLLKIISILIVLLLVPTGCSKESILPSTDETPDKPGNILTLDKALEAILPEEEANPYAKPGFVRAITVGENSYLYDFKGKRVIILENTAEGFMNTNREDIVYLKNDGNLYFSDSDLTAPKLIDSNLSDFTNNAFIGDCFYYTASATASTVRSLNQYNFVEGVHETLLEAYQGETRNLCRVETDTEVQFYSVATETGEFRQLGAFPKDQLGLDATCTFTYFDADTDFRIWVYDSRTGCTALTYEDGELSCLAQNSFNQDEHHGIGLTLLSGDTGVIIFERGEIENGGRVFYRRQNQEIITVQQPDCYFLPRATWYGETADGCYLIGADRYAGYDQDIDATLYLYWLGNDGILQRIDEISRPVEMDTGRGGLTFQQMELLDEHTLLYFDGNSYPHLATLDKGTVTEDRLLLEETVREYEAVPYYGGTCVLFTTENYNEYFLHNADAPLVYVGMVINLGGVSTDGEYIYLVTEAGNLYAFSKSEILSYADERTGLSAAYGQDNAIASYVEPDSLTSGIFGGLLDPKSIIFETFDMPEENGVYFYDGTSAELIGTIPKKSLNF